MTPSPFVHSLSTVNRSGIIYRLILWSILLLTVMVVFQAYLLAFWSDPNQHLAVAALVDGTGDKQSVSRVLVPLLVKLIVGFFRLSPESVASGLMFLSLVGFLLAFRYLLFAFWNDSFASDIVTWLSIVLLTPFMFAISQRVYDFPTLLLFTLALGLLAHNSWKPYIVVFVLTSLNRETAFLLILVFAVHFYSRIDRALFRKMVVIQIMIYALIRLSLIYRFWSYPGNLFEFHLLDHFRVLVALPAVFSHFPLAAFVVGLYITGSVFALSLVVYRADQKPVFLRDAALALIPSLFVLYLLFGWPFEIRVFYEAYSVILLLSVQPLFERALMRHKAILEPLGGQM